MKNSVEDYASVIDASQLSDSLAAQLQNFRDFGTETRLVQTQGHLISGECVSVPTYVNEFWTAKQRQASSLHEVSYRACFKSQLPRFFIERLTQPGDVVYDPFMGRGTTPIEAALLGRVPWGNDINPVSLSFARPRLHPPTLDEVATRLEGIDLTDHDEFPEELLVFYHPDTLREICALKKYFLAGRANGTPLNPVDDWLCMVALNRLTVIRLDSFPFTPCRQTKRCLSKHNEKLTRKEIRLRRVDTSSRSF
jgi:hypothetical protein